MNGPISTQKDLIILNCQENANQNPIETPLYTHLNGYNNNKKIVISIDEDVRN